MRLYKGINRLEEAFSQTVVTIGNFDGMHVGHQEILRRAVRRSRELKLPLVVVTFRPHPMYVLRPDTDFSLINSYEEKQEILAGLGVDVLVEEPFSREFSNTTPEEFVRGYLVGKLKARALYLGYDFAFGKNRAGTVEVLKKLSIDCGVETEVVPALERDGVPVSSSRVRKLLEAGNIPQVNEYLGRPFFVRGIVQRGDGRGTKIGFPTANLHPESLLGRKVPRIGVYVTKTQYQGSTYNSVTNVGRNPTFKGGGTDVPVMVETHLFDFDKDLYGQNITVEFYHFIRNEQKFSGVEELVQQIKRDCEVAKKFIKS